MAKVRLVVAGVLAAYTGGRTELETEAENLGQLLHGLAKDFGERLAVRLLEESGEPRRFVSIFVNDRDFRFTGGIQTKLMDGDEVCILPAVSGGALTQSKL